MSAVKPKLTIRLMRRDDADAVARMNQALSGGKISDKPQVPTRFFTQNCFGPHKLVKVYVATCQDHIIGFISSHDWLSFGGGAKVRSIQLLYVLEEWRGQGAATMLLRHTIADAKKSGCKRIDNEADIKNKKANRLYKELEFIEATRSYIRYQLYI